eukprot:TRINITY_DN12937_c0_g1_i2.p1 TRINITY_DN12937_c0_g1~~TRINITY_DN12937_c0_g1_i2.p1  ORF type:complete len:600 (-),score=111.80 TRINITY_DN12937_c0_g1_i2:83-1687(-)
MSVLFATCDAVTSFAIGLATSALDPRVGQLGTGTLFLVTVLSSILAGPAAVKLLGCKRGLLLGLGLQACFAVLFAVAAQQARGCPQQWFSYLLGAVASGTGSGLSWTSQGAFFKQTVGCLSAPEASPQISELPPPGSTEPREAFPEVINLGLFERAMSAPARVNSARCDRPRSRHLSSASSASPMFDSGAFHRGVSPFVSMRQTIYSSTLSPRCSLRLEGVQEIGLAEQPSAAVQEAGSLEGTTAELAGHFAAVLLMMDVVVKVLSGLLQGSLLQWQIVPWQDSPFGQETVLYVFAVLSCFSVMTASAVLVEPGSQQGQQPLLPRSEQLSVRPCEALRAAVELWPSRQVWCLSFTNLSFGLCAGYMNGVVNGEFLAHSSVFGEASIGSLMAFTSLLAAGSAVPLGILSQRTGKGFVLAIGSCALATIPVAVSFGKPSESNNFWGFWLVALYALQGVGRSVYEGTNRAVFADAFPSEKSTGAFANCMMQSGSAFFMSFMMQAFLPERTRDTALAAAVLVLALLTVPGYLLAGRAV